MKSAVLILIMGLAIYSGEERSCGDCCDQLQKKGKTPRFEVASGSKHSITDKECRLIDEWLNRKNMGHFMRNHMNSLQP